MSPGQKGKKKKEQNEWAIQDNIKSTIIYIKDSHVARRIKDKRSKDVISNIFQVWWMYP